MRINAPAPTQRSTDLTGKDFRRIARAIEFAEKSRLRVRVGAYVLYSGRRHTGSCNKERNHPRINYLEASTHAEVAALNKVPKEFDAHTIYVARLGAQGRLLPSHPCRRCLPVLIERGVKRVVWWDGEKWVASRPELPQTGQT
jgi:tRNA(Arg) A34 adenosine deaminase TadA